MSFIIKKDFNEVVEENTNFVTSIARKFVRDPETVKDLTQEIFLRAYQNYERYNEDGKIRAWLSVIAHNMLKNHYKAEQNQSSHIVLSPLEYISEELLPYKYMPEDIVIQRDILDKITNIINSLPEKQRDIIVYSYFYDYSEKEIASLKDMSLSAVKSAKYFGLQKVRNILGADYSEYGSDSKYKLNNNFGRYRMIKCYAYDNGRFTENTDLKSDSIIEMVSPTKKDISDVARFFTERKYDMNEDTLKALINGDLDKVREKYIASTQINGLFNVSFIEVENMIICHDKSDAKQQEILQAVQKIWSLINVPGYINVDYADVCALFRTSKSAAVGTGRGKGENKINAGVNALLSSPEMENMIDNTYGVIISITGNSSTLSLDEVYKISTKVEQKVHKDAYIVWGVNFDDTLDDEIVATVMATE
ncbi:MAG: sigma-70 family RNA polymerase sigma factor [Oscillospiraceae bacterium]|nr:sigma-70 family RNA polymerase sigma factor [Oscillospiraceae bacterium]